MPAAKPRITCVLDAKAELGENPCWSARERALYWIECGIQENPPAVHRFDPATGETRSWILPEKVGSFALTDRQDRLIVALQTGIFVLDLLSGATQLMAAAPFDSRHYRFNDGRCDSAGRFWVGSVRLRDIPIPPGGAAIYRYDGYSLDVAAAGFTESNGMAFSPEGGRFYYADSYLFRMFAFDLDPATGTLSHQRDFAQLDTGQVPDGAAIDDQGGYWIAVYDHGRIHRYTPDGALDRVIEFPVSKPTMVAFGGDDLTTMYVTSAWRRLSPEQKSAQPLAGGVFAIEGLGYRGIPEPVFKLPVGAQK